MRARQEVSILDTWGPSLEEQAEGWGDAEVPMWCPAGVLDGGQVSRVGGESGSGGDGKKGLLGNMSN